MTKHRKPTFADALAAANGLTPKRPLNETSTPAMKSIMEVLGYGPTSQLDALLKAKVEPDKILDVGVRTIIVVAMAPNLTEETKAERFTAVDAWLNENLDLPPDAKKIAMDKAKVSEALSGLADQEKMSHDWMFCARHYGHRVQDDCVKPTITATGTVAFKEEGFSPDQICDLVDKGFQLFQPSAETLTESFLKHLFSRPESSIYHHKELGIFHGTINGVPMPKATTERGLFSHLVNKHKWNPDQAKTFIDAVKSGSHNGKPFTKMEEILKATHHQAILARSHHFSGNHIQRDSHLKNVSDLMDRAHEMGQKQLQHNPHLYRDAHLPHHNIYKAYHQLHQTIHSIKD
jgi:hypothetical protein